jgi:hypothetical protein
MISIRKDYFNHIEWRNKLNQFHREDGPAIEKKNGKKFWLLNGKYHRKNGPAIDNGNITNQWWKNGNRTSFHIADIRRINDWTLIYTPIR